MRLELTALYLEGRRSTLELLTHGLPFLHHSIQHGRRLTEGSVQVMRIELTLFVIGNHVHHHLCVTCMEPRGSATTVRSLSTCHLKKLSTFLSLFSHASQFFVPPFLFLSGVSIDSFLVLPLRLELRTLGM